MLIQTDFKNREKLSESKWGFFSILELIIMHSMQESNGSSYRFFSIFKKDRATSKPENVKVSRPLKEAGCAVVEKMIAIYGQYVTVTYTLR